MEKFYITTAIDYVNGSPHIGHAYEKILTDVIFRHFAKRTKNAYFLTGCDEHGIKIQKTAAKLEICPQDFCNNNAQKFVQCWNLLDIHYNQLIRTTNTNHKKIVQKIFKKLLEKGDIYKHSYKGLYCSGCECFLSDKDLDENGCCLIHQKKPDLVSEENYFFKLTKYKDRIIEYIKTHPDFIVPDFRAKEVLNQLQDIEDISVSRAKSSVNWGIDVLDDDSQVIYVWIDALSNYITALGYNPEGESDELFKKYWPANVQVIGKDILKFHSIYWLAILMALDLPLPKHILAHGWITLDEAKMSKSLGNVVSPENVLKGFELNHPDAFRYYLAASAPVGKDGNYSDLDFKEKVNAQLANSMGNLLNRTLSMLVKYFDGIIKPEFIVKNELFDKAQVLIDKTKTHFDNFEVQEASVEIMEFVCELNKFVTDNAPWTLAKEEKWTQSGQTLYVVLELMCVVAFLIEPYCPNIARLMAQQLKFDINTTFDDIMFSNIKAQKLISKEEIKPVFLRIDSEFADKK